MTSGAARTNCGHEVRACVHARTMGLTARRVGLGALLLMGVAASAVAQPRGTARVVLVVEVLTFDPRPVIPCGRIGAQPRDATARVERVVEGQWTAPTIELSWPVCEWNRIAPGQRHQIRVVRRTGTGDDSQRRFRVRASTAIR